MFGVEDDEGGFHDQADLPGVEADVPQGLEVLREGVRAFADGPQGVVDPVVPFLVVGEVSVLGLLVRDRDLAL